MEPQSKNSKKSKNDKESVQRSGPEKQEYKTKIIWRVVAQIFLLHLAGLYGFYSIFTSANWKTTLFGLILVQIANLGVTAGAHRLWCHRAYEAKWPLRVLLCIMNTISLQKTIFKWCRYHRIHHKYSDTDGDPHNINRGFFFAHLGWVMCESHPEVIQKKKTIVMDDLLNDPIVRFQRRFYIPLVFLFGFYLPTMIPVWYWGETAWNSFLITTMLRHCISLNSIFLVNSFAHKYGNQPFDRNVVARENPIVSFFATGEGWHNYHHVFPSDYATSELGYKFNLAKLFIDAMSKIGLAYNLKTISPKTIADRKLKSGDGTRVNFGD